MQVNQHITEILKFRICRISINMLQNSIPTARDHLWFMDIIKAIQVKIRGMLISMQSVHIIFVEGVDSVYQHIFK